MHYSTMIYDDDGVALHGFAAFDDSHDNPRPAVIIAHDWTGRNEFACEKAKFIAEMGMVGFALDMYGEGRQGKDNDEKGAMMTPLIENRALLRRRMQAALAAVKAMPQVDDSRIVVIGYCFGGLCALDLARDGADIKGVVSFHGLLAKPDELDNQTIKAKVLVLHGYADPMVEPAQVNHFCQEMTESEVDWQVHMYGNTLHAFTNPEANDPGFGTVYSKTADERSWQAMLNFIAEVTG